MSRRGFTIIEVVIALAVAVTGLLLVTEALSGASGAAKADQAKSQAVRTGDSLLRRLALELSQTTVAIDNALPPGENQRLWILANGVRFQKVVGHDVALDGSVTQQWSPPISYTWDANSGVVTRAVTGGSSLVAGTGVIAFAVQTNASGQVSVALATRAGAVNRGTDGGHQRVIRVTPRNTLK